MTAVPPVTQPWPYTLTVEIRPMPQEWQRYRAFNLNTGERLSELSWYTRWNRAYVIHRPLPEESDAECTVTTIETESGWLAVVQE